MHFLKSLFLILFLFLLNNTLWSQSASQAFLIKTELDKRGLSEAEADAGLISKGLDVKKMSPEEVLSKQAEILGVLDALSAAKKPNEVAKVEEAILVLDTILISKETSSPNTLVVVVCRFKRLLMVQVHQIHMSWEPETSSELLFLVFRRQTYY